MMCIDAMEMIPPEDWQAILGRFRRALRRNGLLYLTVERHAEELVRTRNEEARRRGLPVVDGEVMWEDSGYHFYPGMERVRGWLKDSGFTVEDDAEGPWEGYAYHHVLARIGT